MLSKLYGYLVGFLALAAGIFGLFTYAKRQGKKDEQAAETEKSLQQAKEANDTDTRVRNMSDSALDAKLRDVQRPR